MTRFPATVDTHGLRKLEPENHDRRAALEQHRRRHVYRRGRRGRAAPPDCGRSPDIIGCYRHRRLSSCSRHGRRRNGDAWSSGRTLRCLRNPLILNGLEAWKTSPAPIPFTIRVWTRPHSAGLSEPVADGWQTEARPRTDVAQSVWCVGQSSRAPRFRSSRPGRIPLRLFLLSSIRASRVPRSASCRYHTLKPSRSIPRRNGESSSPSCCHSLSVRVKMAGSASAVRLRS